MISIPEWIYPLLAGLGILLIGAAVAAGVRRPALFATIGAVLGGVLVILSLLVIIT